MARRASRAPAYEVRESPIHGKGLFATRRIPKGARIGELEGPQTTRDGPHVLWYVDDEDRVVGRRGTNELRFVNHASRPNAGYYGPDLHAERTIEAGEEITIHYGDDWE